MMRMLLPNTGTGGNVLSRLDGDLPRITGLPGGAGINPIPNDHGRVPTGTDKKTAMILKPRMPVPRETKPRTTGLQSALNHHTIRPRRLQNPKTLPKTDRNRIHPKPPGKKARGGGNEHL